MSHSRVLIIEDEPVFGEVLGEELRLAGFEADVSTDGNQGLARFKVGRHAMVVTDIILPGREGLELLQTLKREAPSVKIVAMSGGGRVVGSRTMLEMAQRLGADAVLTKPFPMSDLVDTLRRLQAA